MLNRNFLKNNRFICKRILGGFQSWDFQVFVFVKNKKGLLEAMENKYYL